MTPTDAARRRGRVAEMIRVDHAGEYGATRIYAGQLAVLGGSPVADELRHMAEQEERHLEFFERQIVERRVRPSVLHPLWHFGGFALGAVTAALGERAAMACTVAVEEVIEDHYRAQIEELGGEEPELSEAIAGFLEEELEHRDLALERGARGGPVSGLVDFAVRAVSRVAIRVATRL